jgi:hypothetical protein
MSENHSLPPTSQQMRIFRQAMIDGVACEELAGNYQLTLETIQRNIRRVERWLAVQVTAQESVLVGNLHLERLEHQWNELMAAWVRSKQDEVVSKATTDQKGNQRVERIHKSATGEVRYLEQARRVLADIRTLLGIQHIPTEEELMNNVESLTLEQRGALLHRLVERVRDAQAGMANVPTDRGRSVAQPHTRSDDRTAAE